MELTVKEQIKEIGDGLKELVKKAQDDVKELAGKAASKEEISALQKEWQKSFDAYAEKHEEKFQKLQDQADALETKAKKPGAGQDKTKSFEENIGEALEAHKDGLKSIRNAKDKNPSVGFEVKAAANMSLGNYSGGTIGLTTWDAELVRTPLRRPFVRQLVSNRRITSLYVAWAEMVNRDGAADTVAEGAKKPQIDFDIVEASKKVEKIAAFIKASKESLDDIAFLQAEINQELGTQVNLKLDQQILSGDGVSPNLKGILTYAPTLSVVGTPFATGIATPNRADVVVVAASVVRNAFFEPNYVVVHPYDVAMMMLDKDTQGNSINRVYVANGITMIDNIQVIANTGVTVGTFLLGDFTKDVLGIREEFNIQIGFENDDFTKNLVTILGEMRAVNYIKSQNVNAFVKGTFSTVITAITKA